MGQKVIRGGRRRRRTSRASACTSASVRTSGLHDSCKEEGNVTIGAGNESRERRKGRYVIVLGERQDDRRMSGAFTCRCSVRHAVWMKGAGAE